VNPPKAYLRHGEADYPAQLTEYLGERVRARVATWGEQGIWFKRDRPLLALFCSTKAPASIILGVHDLAQQWRTGRATIISGFHTPVEQECLAVLLRGPQPIIVSLKARGTGLNLTAANHVFHFDRWWNPAVEDQATDRALRFGQKRDVQVHKFICAGTLEEHIDAHIESKRALAESVVGAGEGWLTKLSTDELRDIMTLRKG